MIDPQHPNLSIRRQSELLKVNRNRLNPAETRTSEDDEAIMKQVDVIHTKCPFLGGRKIIRELRDLGIFIGRKRMRRLMKVMGIEAMVPKPNTSKPAPGHKIYPYLLREKAIEAADEVWCTDITYLPMESGHAYLIAIMDWHTRAVLSWEVSNTMDTNFCLRALRRALDDTGRKPLIMNTDQGSQFTGKEWTTEIEGAGIKVSMDGKGRWMDNVFIERLWRSLKYEKLRLWSYRDIPELTGHISDWMNYYNHERKHQTLNYETPWSHYCGEAVVSAA
jgi:putative transposase